MNKPTIKELEAMLKDDAIDTVRLNPDGSVTVTPKQPTLHDRFAMAALMGLLANPSLDLLPPHEAASDSLLYADAMLEARK